MKEKEVDVYLSLAGMCHLVMIGTGGALVNEIFGDSPRFEIIFVSAFGFILIGIASAILYATVFDLIKKK